MHGEGYIKVVGRCSRLSLVPVSIFKSLLVAIVRTCFLAFMEVPSDEEFNLSLRQRHLEQLRHVEIQDPERRIPGPPLPLPPDVSSGYEKLVKWSKQAKEQIDQAVTKRQ